MIKGLRLTRREREIYDLAMKGLTNEQIANELDMGKKVVENHKSNILNKADAPNFRVLAHMHYVGIISYRKKRCDICEMAIEFPTDYNKSLVELIKLKEPV